MLTLKRTYRPGRTTGVLTLPDGSEVQTLERSWANNAVGVSCIPEGVYTFERDTHGRFQWWRVLDVPGRTSIEFHLGTKPSHSEGCILFDRDGLNKMMEFYDDINVKYVLKVMS